MTLDCPLPLTGTDRVLLGHGSGGKLSAALTREVFLPAFGNPALAKLDDQAIFEAPGARLAFSTDSYVVTPLFFRGGDIGHLAVNGTINDLAVGGAQPLYLSAAFILEEGFPLADLRRIVQSMAAAASQAGVAIVTGDTKVVERGSGNGVFITTSGVGAVAPGLALSAANPKPGDRILLSGPIGDHGITILAERGSLGVAADVRSDTAALHGLVKELVDAKVDLRCMRDPTRGGLASTLNEIAAASQTGAVVYEERIPVRTAVRGACELLGLDPMYVANEGRLVAYVGAGDAERALESMRRHPLGVEAASIGEVIEKPVGRVVMRTAFGTSRVVDMLAGDQLPRIC